MRRARETFASRYGAGPLHLLGALASFAVIAVAARGWFDEPAVSLKYILIWFAGAALAHDMLALPLYAGLDRLGSLLAGRRPSAPGPARVRATPWVYVRVPLLLSGLVLLVFGPEILRKGNDTFLVASGQQQDVYLGRYLILVAALFVVSALAYLLTSRRRGAPVGEPHEEGVAEEGL